MFLYIKSRVILPVHTSITIILPGTKEGIFSILPLSQEIWFLLPWQPIYVIICICIEYFNFPYQVIQKVIQERAMILMLGSGKMYGFIPPSDQPTTGQHFRWGCNHKALPFVWHNYTIIIEDKDLKYNSHISNLLLVSSQMH